jgi:hypothetical protein
MKKKNKVAKFDAIQIQNGALEQEGKFIAAQIKAMRGYEAAAEAKAGVELKKAQDNRTTVEERLAGVYAKCKSDGIKAFRAMYAPDFGRTKLYQILAIGSGKTTREEIRTKERDKKRAQRSAANPGQANAPDTSPEAQPEAAASDPLPAAVVIPSVTELKVGDDVDPEASAVQRRAENAAEVGAEAVVELTAEEKSDEALANFKRACQEHCPKMLEPDLKKARIYFMEAGWKTRRLKAA